MYPKAWFIESVCFRVFLEILGEVECDKLLIYGVFLHCHRLITGSARNRKTAKSVDRVGNMGQVFIVNPPRHV